MSKMRSRGPVAVLLALVGLALMAPSAQAQEPVTQKALDRAHNFLKTANRGHHVLKHVHYGADYKGHAYRKTLNVRGRPGHFALVYRFDWENDGVTDLAFLCDNQGNVYEVQVLHTNAVLQQPYLFANLSITVVGNLLLDAFRNQMTPMEIQQARRFIDNPNSRGLLELSLRLQQALGG